MQSTRRDEQKTSDTQVINQLPLYIPDEDLVDKTLLSEEGRYGKVYLAKWNGKNVAVKQIATCRLWLERCEREHALMRECKHNNIVAYFGHNIDKSAEIYTIVMEHAAKGNLRNYLKTVTLNWSATIHILSGIAEGIAYLHKLDILHLDIKLENILIDRDGNVKLCDFGFAKKANQVDLHTGGTIVYLPPEHYYNEGPLYNKKYDIYAMGITFWETIAQKEAFDDLSENAIINLKVKDGVNSALHSLKYLMPQEYSKTLSKFIKTCWAFNPQDRPTIETVCTKLKLN